MAEREGFEPPVRLPVQLISSQPHSTTLPPLREVLPYYKPPSSLVRAGQGSRYSMDKGLHEQAHKKPLNHPGMVRLDKISP